MTLKYESEILFDLMKRDGDNAPSDVLPYESELKEKYLNQVEGAYPKLQDYRPEWLNYNLYHHLPSDFPTESVTNVTNASFENVVPYAYKSAILTGQTLVNLFNVDDSLSVEISYSRWKYQNQVTNLIGGNKYYVYFFNKLNNLPLHIKPLNTEGEKDAFNVEANTGKVVTLDSTITNALGYYYFKEGWTGEESKQDIIDNCKILFIEYQDGMENWDIPYFEGMQSVKMPVLTTTGKNLFDGEVEIGTVNSDTGELVNYTQRARTVNFLNIKPNTSYSLKSFNEYQLNRVFFYDSQKNYISNIVIDKEKSIVTSPENARYIKLVFKKQIGTAMQDNDLINISNNIQLEEGSVATPYEPFKSNILTVNEEVELRGIGDVRDTLDVNTGKVTERIGEVVLDGSEDEDWKNISSSDNTSLYAIYATNLNKKIGAENVFCDRFNAKNTYNTDEESIFGSSSNEKTIYIRINSNKLVTQDVEHFKAWLSQNPITIQYQLRTESVKTVDLSCVNEQGDNETFRPIEGTMHVNTSSQTLPPLLDMSVPVEATTQNLMSFANLEEEE